MQLDRCPECDVKLPRGKRLHRCPVCRTDWGYPGWPDRCPNCEQELDGARAQCPHCDQVLADSAREIARLRREVRARLNRRRWLVRIALWGSVLGGLVWARYAGWL